MIKLVKSIEEYNTHAKAVIEILETITETYPDVISWFEEKVLPDLGRGRFIMLPMHDGIVAGVGIGKTTKEEKKICTLVVKDGYRRMGIGKSLLNSMLGEFGADDFPTISVSEEHLKAYVKLFDGRFIKTHVEYGIYREKSLEYFFTRSPTEQFKR